MSMRAAPGHELEHQDERAEAAAEIDGQIGLCRNFPLEQSRPVQRHEKDRQREQQRRADDEYQQKRRRVRAPDYEPLHGALPCRLADYADAELGRTSWWER